MLSVITFDIDWAPDWCVDLCAGMIREANARATFFITHESEAVERLRAEPEQFELGIHPNLLPGSSHGGEPREVLDHCVKMVPEARAVRTHSLVQDASLFAIMADEYPQLETDVSLFLPFHTDLKATDLFAGRTGRRLVRLPYYWEDDVAATWPGWDWNAVPPDHDGLRIFDFHPIHVALNMDSMERYAALRKAVGRKPLAEVTESECAPFVNRGAGAATFLRRVLAGMSETISAIADRYRAATDGAAW